MWCSSHLRHVNSNRGFDSKVGKVSYLYPACGGHSLHNKTNDNGKWMVHFALVRGLAVTITWYQNRDIQKVTWRSPNNKICKQIYHILVDRRQCTSVCEVTSMKGTEIRSDHFLMRDKIRLEIMGSEKTKKSEIKERNIGKLK